MHHQGLEMNLNESILRTYPWWEMHRVRELSLGPQTPDRRLSNEWRHTPGLVDHTYRGITTPNCDTLYSGAWLTYSSVTYAISQKAIHVSLWLIASGILALLILRARERTLEQLPQQS